MGDANSPGVKPLHKKETKVIPDENIFLFLLSSKFCSVIPCPEVTFIRPYD